MKTKILIAAAALSIVCGCSAPPTPVATVKAPAAPAAQTDFESKMKSMTAEQRAAYVQAHHDEVVGAYGLGGPKR